MKQRELIDRKLDAMHFLWDRGSATLQEIHNALGEEVSLPAARTVVLVLEEEGYMRPEPEEDIVRYCPTVSRQEVGRRAARRVLEGFFDGSIPDFLHALGRAAGWPEEKVKEQKNRLQPAKSDFWLPPRSV